MSDGPNDTTGAATLPGSGSTTMQVPRASDVIVTVRDNAGAVLADAIVEIEEDGQRRAGGTTDDTGLVRVQVRARNTLRIHASLRGVASAADLAAANPSRLLTIFLLFRYPLVRRFPWQSDFLRSKVFWDEPQKKGDAGAAEARGGQPPKTPPAYERTRNWVLLNIIKQLDAHYRLLANALASAETARTRLRRGNGTPAERDEAQARVLTAQRDLDDYEDQHFARRSRAASQTTHGAASSNPASTPAIDEEPSDSTDTTTTTPGPAPQASPLSEADIHRNRLTYVLRTLLPPLSTAELPLWIRYGLIHFSGLRYITNHGQYARLSRVLTGLREPEILELEHPARGVGSAADHLTRQQLFREEYLSFITGPTGDQLRAAIENADKELVDDEQMRFNLLHRDDTPRPTFTRRETGYDSLRRSLENVNVDAVVPLTRVLARTALVLSAVWAESRSVEECYGAIVDRKRSRHMPLPVFKWIVRKTPLRNDFASEQVWGRPDLPARFARLANAAYTQDWRVHHRATLEPISVSVVCNELVEMASAARGVLMQGGIQGDSTAAFDDPAHPPTEASHDMHAAGEDGMPQVAAVDPIANGASLAAAHPSEYRLFRAHHHSDLQPGDIYFVRSWAKFPVGEPSAVVSPTTSMDLRIPGPEAATAIDEAPGTVTDEAIHLAATPPPPFAGATGLVARHARYIVGRESNATKFNYYLCWRHIGVYIGPKHSSDGAAVTLETDAPAGLGTKSLLTWKFVFGRAHLPAGHTAPDLQPFLDPDLLLDGLDAPVTPI